MFQIELSDPAEAEAIISNNITCPQTGIIFKRKKQPKCANCKGPHVTNYKGCPAYKKQVFRQHVVDNQKSYASILKQN